MRIYTGTCQNVSHHCCDRILLDEWHYSMSEKNCCQRWKSSSVLGSCSWGENAIPDWLMDRYKLLQWCGAAPVSTGDETAAVKDKVLNIPVNLPCDPHLRAAVGGGCKAETTNTRGWNELWWLSSASGRAPRSNRNQRSSKRKRKQIRHLLRVSREVVGASPARRRPCGTARTW